MATIFQPNFNTNPTGPQTQQIGASQSLGSGGGATMGAGGAHPVQPSMPQGSGQAPNIQKYLDANAGGGQQIANSIQNSVQNQANQADQNLQRSQQNFNNQASPLEQEMSNANNVISQSFQDPNKLINAYNSQYNQPQGQQQSPDQQNLVNTYNEFQRLKNGGENYDISQLNTDTSQAQNNLNNIQQAANNAGNAQGQFQLLQQTFGNPQYGAGQQMLDQLLLQNQPSATQGLQQNLNSMAQQTGQNINNFTSQNQARLAALQGLSNGLTGNIQNQFTQNFNDINKNVQGEEQALKNQIAANSGQGGIIQDFQNGTLSPQDLQQLQALGLNPGMQTWDVFQEAKSQLPNWLTAGQLASDPQQAAAQSANQDEFARYQALQQLAGSGLLGQISKQQIGQNQADTTNIFGGATQAGGFNPLNLSGQFQQEVQNRQNYYQQEGIKDLLNSINQSMGGGLAGNYANSFSGFGYGGEQTALGGDLENLYQQAQNGNLSTNAANILQSGVQQAYLDAINNPFPTKDEFADPSTLANDSRYQAIQGYLQKYFDAQNNTLANPNAADPNTNESFIQQGLNGPSYNPYVKIR